VQKELSNQQLAIIFCISSYFSLIIPALLNEKSTKEIRAKVINYIHIRWDSNENFEILPVRMAGMSGPKRRI